MKCPKCQSEVMDNAKFCTKCGCNLAEEKAKMQPKAAACAKCGALLQPGAKFCTKCGTPAAAPAQEPEEKTMFLFGDTAGNNTGDTIPVNMMPGNNMNNPGQGVNQPGGMPPMPGAIVPPTNKNKKDSKKKKEKPQKAPKQQPQQPVPPKAPKQQQPKKKTNVGLIIAAVILSVLVVASAVLCVLVWKGTISLPFFDRGFKTSEESTTEESTEGTTDAMEAIDADEYFADTDALLKKGKGQIAVDAEIVNGMETIKSAIDEFVTKAEETQDALVADERIADAFDSYVTAVTKHKDMLSGQTLSGGIYSQIMTEFNDAAAMGDELAAKGYTIDTSSLKSARDEFDKSYTEKIIQTFNEFTTRETWSRTEAWNLMADTADNMFDPSDLDNPIRLRYAYALSWWTQKQIETEMNNGTITSKGAAIKIGNLMEAMDYNPMMLYYYIMLMDDAGEDCTEAGDAFLEIMERLEETQGLVMDEDVTIDHFWYFNDFGAYSVDDKNGVTPENRQWIRDRMSSVTFVQ